MVETVQRAEEGRQKERHDRGLQLKAGAPTPIGVTRGSAGCIGAGAGTQHTSSAQVALALQRGEYLCRSFCSISTAWGRIWASVRVQILLLTTCWRVTLSTCS